MFLKFIQQELVSLVKGLGHIVGFLAAAYWLCIKVVIVLTLILIPIACLCKRLPGWVFTLEVLGIIVYRFIKRYGKYRKDHADEDVEEENIDENEDVDDEYDIDEYDEYDEYDDESIYEDYDEEDDEYDDEEDDDVLEADYID